MKRMEGKVTLITGGSRGQGAAAARLFVAEGATVIITDVLDEEGESLAAELRAQDHAIEYDHLDVGSGDDWERVVDRVRSDHGRLDGLVNNAGVSHRFGIMKCTPEDWDRILRINLTGCYLGMRSAVPLMAAAGGGAIVNVSSIAGLTAYSAAAYAASKWGLRGLTKVAALEFAGSGIRVNSIHPGIIDTPMLDTAPQPLFDAFTRVTPMGRAGSPEEVAELVLYLLSDASGYVSGAEIAIDGAFSAAGQMRAVLNDLEAATGAQVLESP